jgi:4-cresol dehydrogenase (hydroxylating) flavoprotein subunit
VDALRPLRQDGTIRSAVHVVNGYKVLSAIRRYPWEEMGGRTPLSAEVMDAFARDWKFGAWNGSGGLYGSKEQVKAGQRRIRAALGGRVSSLRFIDDGRLAFMERWAQPLKWVTGQNLPELLKILKPAYELMKGVPTDSQIPGTYWRKRGPVPADPHPDRDGCGLLWCAPILPMVGDAAYRVYEMASAIMVAGGYEPTFSMTLLTERSISCVISITYDRDLPGEDERARAVYEQLLGRLNDEGYYPYRSGIQSMSTFADRSDEGYVKVMRALKGALDPAGVLAPGRYEV